MPADEHAARRNVKRRSIPGTSEAEERLLAMVTALTGQLAVTRERVDTLERLLARAELMNLSAIEEFAATEEETAERDALRRGLIAKVFRPLQEAAERDLRLAESAAEGSTPDPDRGAD